MAARPARLSRCGIAAAVSLALFTWSHAALAQSKPPKTEDVAAVAQYRESIPTSSGPSLPGSSTPRTTSLPQLVRKAITRDAGPSAPLLRKAATSSTYGAPQKPLPHPVRKVTPRSARYSSPIGSAPGRFFEAAGDERILGLLGVLVAITAGLAVAARRSA